MQRQFIGSSITNQSDQCPPPDRCLNNDPPFQSVQFLAFLKPSTTPTKPSLVPVSPRNFPETWSKHFIHLPVKSHASTVHFQRLFIFCSFSWGSTRSDTESWICPDPFGYEGKNQWPICRKKAPCSCNLKYLAFQASALAPLFSPRSALDHRGSGSITCDPCSVPAASSRWYLEQKLNSKPTFCEAPCDFTLSWTRAIYTQIPWPYDFHMPAVFLFFYPHYFIRTQNLPCIPR